MTVRVSVHRLAGTVAVDRTNTWVASIDRGVSEPLTGDFTFDEESVVSEMQFNGKAVLDRLMDRFAAAFGMWRSELPP